MENFQIITLQRSRNFSNKVNATFEFIKQNFGSLIKSLLVIAGPSVLIATALIGSMMGNIFSSALGGQSDPSILVNQFTSPSFWLEVVLFFVFVMVSTIMTLAVINNYIVLYDEKKTNQIEVAEVWERVRGTFWSYLGAILVLTIGFILLYIIMILIVAGMAAMSSVLSFIGVLAAIAMVGYVLIAASLTLFIITWEKKTVFEALPRSFELIYGKWWRTFGYIFIVYMIVTIISWVISSPFYVYVFMQDLHSIDNPAERQFSSSMGWSLSLFYAFYYFVSTIVSMLPNIALAFQYFNLVELKESRGLMNQISSIGETPTPHVSNEEQY